MDWTSIANLILNVGLPAAEKLWQLATSKANPTQADFDALKGLANQTAKDKMKAQLTAAGIALDDPKAVALLGMT